MSNSDLDSWPWALLAIFIIEEDVKVPARSSVQIKCERFCDITDFNIMVRVKERVGG